MTRIFRITNLSGIPLDNADMSTWTNSTTAEGWTPVLSPTVERSENFVKTGLYSMRLANDTGSDQQCRVFQTVDGDEGETVCVAVNLYVTGGEFRFFIQDLNLVKSDTLSVTDTGWMTVRRQLTTTTDRYNIVLMVFEDTTEVYIDRVLVGNNEMDLIDNTDSIFHVKEYFPSLPDYKGGGVFRASPLSNGRQLVDNPQSNLNHSVLFNAKQGASGDEIDEEFESLQFALEQAAGYWSRLQPYPYYLEYKPNSTTETLRATIVKGRVSQLGDPFNIEIEQLHRLDNTLLLETLQWSELPPNFSKAVEIGNSQEFDGGVFGNVDDSEDFEPKTNEVFIAPRRNVANISHAYYYDASGATFSSNIQAHNFATPTGLLPASVATGDILYLGCQTSLTDSGTFASAVFDIGTGLGAAIPATWEYWDGSAWSSLTVEDKTDGLQNAGVNAVSWIQPSDWATTSVNSVTGYWVRMVLGVGSTVTEPTQQNRRIYAVTWPSVTIPRSSVNGAIEALTRFDLEHQGVSSIDYDRIIAGYRSWRRGREFTPVINISDEQNPSGVSVTLYTSGSFTITFASDSFTAPAERYASMTGGTSTVAERARITLSSSVAKDFSGRFRIFGRVVDSGVSNTFTHKLVIKSTSGSPSVGGEVKQDFVLGSANQIVDFGEFTIKADLADSVQIQWHIGGASGSFGDLVDLWLIPADEYIVDLIDNDLTGDGFVNQDYKLVGDSTKTKNKRVSTVFDDSGDAVARYTYIGKEIGTKPKTRGSLVFLPLIYDVANSTWAWADHELLQKITVHTNDQYKIGRGST